MDGGLYLVLENGARFKGKPFGRVGEVTAEVVFTTGMTGYLETLTDSSYAGQIIVQTFPLIGNYGEIPADFESAGVAASGYIVNERCAAPSNFRSAGDLDGMLKRLKVVGLYGIDTRALTKTIREQGVMNGAITPEPDAVDLKKLREYRVTEAVERVSCDKPYTVNGENFKRKIALFDFGLKTNIIRELTARGCSVTVLPYNSTAETVKAGGFDGVMLSNGPGDPADNTGVIENLKGVTALKIPVFGICLGHQLLALSHGFKTEKLKYGHRGANQPARDLTTGRVYITSQNHGYAVSGKSVDKKAGRELFVNVNDGTNEGIEYSAFPAFSSQFHPEGCGGPADTEWLFDKFIAAADKYKSRAAARTV